MSVIQIHARMVVAVKIKMTAILVNARKASLELIVKQVCIIWMWDNICFSLYFAE